jgi:hypothetical protein
MSNQRKTDKLKGEARRTSAQAPHAVKSSLPDDRLALKMAVARELGLWDKVQRVGWGGLTAAESGRIGAWMRRFQKNVSEPPAG